MRRAFATVALSVAAASLAVPALANHICYPGTCPGGDAALTAINTPPGGLTAGTTNAVSVDGMNNGDDSMVRTKLKAKGAKVEQPKKVKMFVPADGTYSVFYSVEPKNRSTTADLFACTTAVPEDIDRSNDCGSASAPVI